MAIESRETSATSLFFTGNATNASEIAALRASISSGNTVYSNDLNKIGSLINWMNGHYHTYTDYLQTKTYGNTGDSATYTRSVNTQGPDSYVDVGVATQVGSTISADRHNELKTAINTLRQHHHTITDQTTR